MRSATIDGLDVRVHRGGSGPPLLYLHSMLGEAGRTTFLEDLEADFEVLAPELPGFGRSEAPRWHRVEDAVFFLRSLLDHHDWPPTAVVGSSIGGWLAAELAVWFPRRVRSLVLFDPVGIRVDGEPITDIFMESRRTLLDLLFAEPPDPLEDALGEAVEASEGNLVLHLYTALEATARIGWNPYFVDPQLADRLGHTPVPATVVRGSGDRVITEAYVERYAAMLPEGAPVALGGVGHLPVVEAPGRAAEVVAETLAGTA